VHPAWVVWVRLSVFYGFEAIDSQQHTDSENPEPMLLRPQQLAVPRKQTTVELVSETGSVMLDVGWLVVVVGGGGIVLLQWWLGVECMRGQSWSMLASEACPFAALQYDVRHTHTHTHTHIH